MYEVSLKFSQLDESGRAKKVTLPIIVSGYSFTEAEANANKVAEEEIGEAFLISRIAQVNYSEIFRGEGKWFKARVRFSELDEKGRDVGNNVNMLIQSDNLDKALVDLLSKLSGSIVDYNVLSIKETKLLGVFSFD